MIILSKSALTLPGEHELSDHTEDQERSYGLTLPFAFCGLEQETSFKDGGFGLWFCHVQKKNLG